MPSPERRRIRRGDGEVRDWPRGLLAYVATTPERPNLDPEEDRGQNRQRLALRLLDLWEREGNDVEPARERLRRAAGRRERGERAAADAEVEDVLGELLGDAGHDACVFRHRRSAPRSH